ncbi:MAG TPA: hypothetical protein VNO14_14985 [Blastocatellia bacterium]|nr:hypothetical protein [Blastocatellia bacterium]
MTRCSETRKLIDEADNPEVFSYEAARHIASCLSCKDFAEERARLRQLLGSSAKVVAPANFDAMLSRRLAEARSRRSLAQVFAWSGPAGLLKFGAATAVAIISVFAASYSGLFSTSAPPQPDGESQVATARPPAARQQPPRTSEYSDPGPQTPVIEPQRVAPAVRIASYSSPRQPRPAPARPVIVEPEIITPGTQMVILRGENFEREIPMPTISVGAQPLMYVSAARSSSSSVRASF